MTDLAPSPVVLDLPRRPAPDAARLTDADLVRLADEMECAPAADVVAWAAETFGSSLTLAASMTDGVLIDVASSVAPGIEVVFVDTQYHFQETLGTAEAIAERYPIRLRVVWPTTRPDDLWRTDPDACCNARKVLPMARALQGRLAWVSGLRRVDAPARAETPIIQRDARGLVKVNPLARWTDDDVEAYIAEHDVPVNPLISQGYPSIGCYPCTRAVAAGEDPRAGRWDGTDKTECGLHL